MEDNFQDKINRLAPKLKSLGLSVLPYLKNKYILAFI
ncbi:MAG: hypothetical protein ACI81S_002236, partial [Sphingobacteriales bacterium]